MKDINLGKTQSPDLLNKDDSGGGTHAKMMPFYIVSDDTNCAGDHPIQIWSYIMALMSTLFLQYRSTQSPVSL